MNNLSSRLVLKANKTIYENPGYFFKLWFLPSSKTVGFFKLWLSLNIKYSMCCTGKLYFFIFFYFLRDITELSKWLKYMWIFLNIFITLF